MPRIDASPSSGVSRAGLLLEGCSTKVVLALILSIVGGFIAGIAIVLLIPLLGLVGMDVEHGTAHRFSSFVAGVLTAVGIPINLPAVLAVFVAVVAAEGLLARWEVLTATAVEQEFASRLRTRLYSAIARANWLFLSRSRSSSLTHVLTQEVDRTGSMVHEVLRAAATLVLALVYIAIALQLSATMTLVAIGSGTILLLALHPTITRARRFGERVSVALDDLYSATSEHLGGMKIAKSYCAEERHISHFSRVSDEVAGAYLSSTRNYADRRLFFSIGSVFLLSGLVYLAAEVLFLPAATLLIFLFLFSRLIPRFSALQQSYQQILNALPAVDRVQTLLDRAERAAERPDRMDPALRLRERVHLDKVAFDYSGDGAAIAVKNVSVTIEAGRTTAIVGPSGSGKSTLADLVMGLLVPTKGRVLVDGVSLQSGVLQSWRKHIGYVAQDTFFFHDTVRTNLLWASPNASDQELWEALRLASASHFVEQLPAGIETVVGDRGVKLSGGERQRLALARALLRKPELLILDEATSSLDSENERRVQRAIESLHGEMTILIIAHRLATIRDADHIHVMERGRIVESGAWDDLLARRGRFHELFVTQSLHTSGDLHPHDAEAEGATTTDSAVERTF